MFESLDQVLNYLALCEERVLMRGEGECTLLLTQRLMQHLCDEAVDVDAGGVEEADAVVFLGAKQQR